jgi:hypothetical protein
MEKKDHIYIFFRKNQAPSIFQWETAESTESPTRRSPLPTAAAATTATTIPTSFTNRPMRSSVTNNKTNIIIFVFPPKNY